MADFKRLFVAVVRLAGELGFLTGVKRFAVARFGTLSIDGTKVRANASKRKAQSNFTDPQSRIMKTSTEGFQQCYNAQLAVEGENQLIVAAEVTSNASDQGQMLPRLNEVQADYGAGPETLLADAGYCNEADLACLEERGVDAYVALGRESNKAVAVNAKAHPDGPGHNPDGPARLIHPLYTAPPMCLRHAGPCTRGG